MTTAEEKPSQRELDEFLRDAMQEALGNIERKCRYDADMRYRLAVRRMVIAEQLRLKFGALSYDVRLRVEAADEERLDVWLGRILVAATLDEMFAV